METARGKHRIKVENDIIKKREKAFLHDQLWGEATKYYDHFNQVNTKYENWTSPRYYTSSMKQYEEMKTKQEKEDLLLKRRERLRKLYEEEASSFEVEMMVERNKKITQPISKSKYDDVPYSVLKDINDTFKDAREIKQKQEAETKLYQHWKNNNHVMRSCENTINTKNLKLSWLDQQIEKRMKLEQEEELSKKILKERDENLKKQLEEEEKNKKILEQKQEQYLAILSDQVNTLKQKQNHEEMLKKTEHEEFLKQANLYQIEEKQKHEERRRREKEVALYNIRQYKQKLKQKSIDIEENLAIENEILQKIKNLEITDKINDTQKRQKVKESFEKYSDLVKQHQEVVKEKQKQLDFIFDSEAKQIYEKQCEVWKNEETLRQKLLKDVLSTIKTQIQSNLEKNRSEQIELQRQKEENQKQIDEYSKELEKIQTENILKKQTKKLEIDEDVKVKNARKFQQENIKLKELDLELDRIKKEEERLKSEILNIHKKHDNVRPSTSRHRFY